MQHKKMNRDHVSVILPLTAMQKSMLFLRMMIPESEYYYEQQVYTVCGVTDENMLMDAWNYVVSQNTSLRTLFRWAGLENPIQLILKEYKVPLFFRTLTYLADKEKEQVLTNICLEEWASKPDLADNPLKVTILKRDEAMYEMILTYHHMIMDGWSNAVLMEELLEALKRYSLGQVQDLKQKTEYKDYIKWLYSLDKEEAVAFWKQYLKGYKADRTAATYVPYQECSPGYLVQSMDQEMDKAIMKYTRKYKVTAAAVLYSAWGMVLSEFNQRQDILFGITVSGRPPELAGIEETIGLFIHTIPIRIRVYEDKKEARIVEEVNHDLIQILQYQYIPFDKTFSQIACLEGKLFDSVVTIQNYPVSGALAGGDAVSIKLKKSKYVTDLKITLGIKMFTGHHQIDFCYNRQMVDDELMSRIAARYRFYIHYITKEEDA